MTRREPLLGLRHMLGAAREAARAAAGRTAADLEADRLREVALARLLEILGEAGAT